MGSAHRLFPLVLTVVTVAVPQEVNASKSQAPRQIAGLQFGLANDGLTFRVSLRLADPLQLEGTFTTAIMIVTSDVRFGFRIPVVGRRKNDVTGFLFDIVPTLGFGRRELIGGPGFVRYSDRPVSGDFLLACVSLRTAYWFAAHFGWEIELGLGVEEYVPFQIERPRMALRTGFAF